MLTRTCAGSERRAEKDCLQTHVIQLFDDPRQIFTSQVRKSVSIFIPATEAAELLAKSRRSSVEVMEVLQGIAWDHRDVWLEQRLRSGVNRSFADNGKNTLTDTLLGAPKRGAPYPIDGHPDIGSRATTGESERYR